MKNEKCIYWEKPTTARYGKEKFVVCQSCQGQNAMFTKMAQQANHITELLDVLEESWPVIAALANGAKPDTWVMKRIEQHMVDAIAKTKED